MKSLSVKALSPLASQVKELYLASFTKEERLPYWFLLLQAWRRKADFRAYVDQDQLVGFSYTIAGAATDFLLFLAVSAEYQSQGFGTAILQEVKKATDRPLIVTIEPPFVPCDNAEQRKRRLAFYEKNGLYLTEHFYYENTERYQVMTSRLPFDLEGFSRDLRSFFKGIIKTKVV